MLKFTFQHINNAKNNNGNSWKPIFVFFALLSFLSVSSQNLKKEVDSIVKEIGINNRVNQLLLESKAENEKKARQEKYINYQRVQKQNRIFNLIELEVQNAKFLLNRGFDYKDITEEIHQLKEWEEFSVKGIVGKQFRVLTDRNLSSTSILLYELLKRTNNRLKKISIENQQLGRTREKIDSLVAEKNLYYVPKDSIAREIYRLQSLKMNTDIDIISERLKNAVDSIQTLEIMGDQLRFKIETDIIINDRLRKIEVDQLFTKKVPVFERPNIKKLMIDDPMAFSIKTNYLVVYFYLINNKNSILTMLILILGTAIYFKLQKRKFLDFGYKKDMLINFYMLNNPLASAILVVLNIYQFILPMPPLIFSIIIWTISTIALTIIMWRSINTFIWKIWTAIFLLNLLAFFDLIILIHFVGESFLILGINCLGIAIGVYAFINRSKIQRKVYLWYILAATILQFLSFYYLVNGNYNLSKFLMTKSVYTIVTIFSLYSTFIIVKEINLISKILEGVDEDKRKKTLIGIPHKFTLGYYLILFVCCFLLMVRNTYTFQNIIDPFRNTLSEPRSLGNITFTFENIMIFIIVILLSSFISKVVSFLASDDQIISTKNKTKNFGSMLFLSRIAIVTLGVLIAFASAGIPMDKLTLIISALGVGIGFGMQNLVNNLISGLIIAFEKPVSLDDIIEVGTQSGKMKSIGIRSSVVTTFDGADVIIPNGELLNQNLTNWTLGSSTRRSEIRFGVAYGTDLELTKKLIFEILENNKNVLMKPLPAIWFTKFGDSSIDLVLKYWISHFDFDNDTRSELIIAIDKTLKENNIVIPFSQQDIHIITKEIEIEPESEPEPKIEPEE
ncbi:mechanosensitive ion channel domain-containing protein [Flavobacterium granuli]|uniref:Small-conductance mechanosensitive channel n=1 Tax=Flavobacterium granuli TaxID=280093 RepID=A0ABU1RY12_9FLAO|nr:mechanosensitive ion channel domain-containing protein [Flavobacterium granuli]MDR6843648.1 small-conductance mechanosensitive channel [Flavobacterium granuli]